LLRILLLLLLLLLLSSELLCCVAFGAGVDRVALRASSRATIAAGPTGCSRA